MQPARLQNSPVGWEREASTLCLNPAMRIATLFLLDTANAIAIAGATAANVNSNATKDTRLRKSSWSILYSIQNPFPVSHPKQSVA